MKKALASGNFAVVAWVLLLVAVPTVFYVSHVYNQLGEVRENNLRTLSKAATSTINIIERAARNVRSLEKKPTFVCDFLDRQPYLTWGGNGDCPDIKGLQDPDPTGNLAGLSKKFANARLRRGTNGVQVWAGYGPSSSSIGQSNSLVTKYVFNVELDTVLAAIPFSDALDLLLVADADGNVIRQFHPAGRQNVGLSLSSLDNLRTGTMDVFTNMDVLQRASSVSKVRLSDADYQLLCQPLKLTIDDYSDAEASISQVDTAVSKENGGVAGTNTDNGDEVDKQGNWLLCGLVASERSLQQSLTVAPFLAFAFFAVTVFGILTWPAIKLLWMSRRDRLDFADLGFLLFGTMGTLLLATTLILGTGAHHGLATASQESLIQLAEQIESNLQDEVTGITNSLRTIDTKIVRSLAPSDSSEAAGIANIENIYFSPVSSEQREQRARTIWRDVSPADWPGASDVEVAFWVDCNGDQVFKATMFDQNTPMINLDYRSYFKAVVQDRLWNDPGSSKDIPHYVEPVRSVVTGKFTTVISIRSDVEFQTQDAECRGESGMAAATVSLTSISKPVLPPGVGFAIVDREGTAVFHSDERRALFEVLYEEMDDGDRLESAVLARSSAVIDTSYLARPHQVYVMPMSHMPWSIVTFSDTEMISTANIEILGHAAMLSFIFLLLYALFALCYFLWCGAAFPLWFWPGSHSGEIAKWSIVIPVAALIALVVLDVYFDGDVVLVAVFCLPLVIFVGLSVACRRAFNRMNRAGTYGDVLPSHIRWSYLSMALVWIAVAIIPAGYFFKAALDSQSRVLIRYENEYLVDQIVGRNCAVDDYYRNINTSDVCQTDEQDRCRLDNRRDYSAGDVYRFAMFGTTPHDGPLKLVLQSKADDSYDCESIPETRDSSSIWSFFAGTKPIYNSTVVRSRYLQPDVQQKTVNNACWSWHPVSATGSSMLAAGPLACDTTVNVESGLPLRLSVFFSIRILALGLALLFGLFLLNRYAVRQLFFGDLQRPPLMDRDGLEEELLARPIDSTDLAVVIVASQWDRNELLKAPDCEESTEARESSKTRGRYERYDMMECLAGSERQMEMLRKIDEDIDAGKSVLLVSPVDPYSLIPAEADSLLTIDESTVPEDHTSTTWFQAVRDEQEISLRWREVLSRFRVVVISINLSPPRQIWKGHYRRNLDMIVSKRWLRAELQAIPELYNLFENLERELKKATRRSALDRIVERASGSYKALWDACSEDEKCVLLQLAFENVVNPKQVAVVRRLIQRGLIVRDPRLRVVNQSFAHFIVQVHDPLAVKDWEDHASKTSWTSKRWVLLGVLALGMLFLSATQRELFNNSLVFLSAAVVGLPSVLKLLTVVNKSGN